MDNLNYYTSNDVEEFTNERLNEMLVLFEEDLKTYHKVMHYFRHVPMDTLRSSYEASGWFQFNFLGQCTNPCSNVPTGFSYKAKMTRRGMLVMVSNDIDDIHKLINELREIKKYKKMVLA